MKAKLSTSDLGQANVMAADILAGCAYPPHSLRLLARAYLELLERVQSYRDAHASLDACPSPIDPDHISLEKRKPKERPCQHGQVPAHDARTTCLACVWMREGHMDAAFTLCEHDRRADYCPQCNA